MPSDQPARLPRALALGLAAVTALSVVPYRVAGADSVAAPRVLDAVVESLASAAVLRPSPTTAPEIAPGAAVTTAAATTIPPSEFGDAGDARLADLASAAASHLTAREEIAADCPDLADPELLRGGAADDGRGLCERSVHGARTDEAAAAIVEGFELLGTPYSRGRRGQDGYDDCSSFVGRAYREAGRPLSDSDWEPSSSVMRNASWADVVDEPLPGDILWRRGHVAMALADGFQMHTSRPGDVSHVRTIGRYTRVLAVDPTTA